MQFKSSNQRLGLRTRADASSRVFGLPLSIVGSILTSCPASRIHDLEFLIFVSVFLDVSEIYRLFRMQTAQKILNSLLNSSCSRQQQASSSEKKSNLSIVFTSQNFVASNGFLRNSRHFLIRLKLNLNWKLFLLSRRKRLALHLGILQSAFLSNLQLLLCCVK